MAWNLFFSKSLKTLLSAPGPNLRRPIMFDLVRHLQDLRTAVACPAALTSRTAVAFPAALTSVLGYSGRFVGAGKYQISGPDADYHPEDHPINLHPSGDIQNPEVRANLNAYGEVQETLNSEVATWNGWPENLVPAVGRP